MTHRKFSRRIFLKNLGLMLLLSGCSSNLSPFTAKPTATPTPFPTPTPLPSADAIAQVYLAAWVKNDYAAMYNLLTPAWQSRLSLGQFQEFYAGPMNVATVQQVETQLQSLLHTQDQAAANFNTIWQTALFGSIQASNQMHLRFTAGRWGVEWQPTLVLPDLGEGVALAFLSERPSRGDIYDKNFHALATQGSMVTVGVVPQFLKQDEVVIGHLSRVTGVSPEKILDNIAKARPNWFVPIGDITFEASLQSDDLLSKLTGVERRATTVRLYNDNDTAAHIIGYMGAIPAEQKAAYVAQGYQGDEPVGLSGVEAWGEAYLAGRRGGRLVTLAPPPARQVMSEIATITPQAGSSVFLSFDTAFQAAVEQLLGPRRGAIVVMDANNGAIYAMATYPRYKPSIFSTGFNPNAWTELYANPERPLLNRATQGLYPAGSIFKIVSLTAALESLKLKPETTFFCNGTWSGLGKEFEKSCWLKTGHGNINLIDGLTQSCNVVFYEVGLALYKSDPQLLPTWARNYGLGLPTEVLGVQESSGVIPDEEWKQASLNEPLFPGDAVNAAIGQGFVLVTPLQIVRMLATLGNGGKILQPRLVDRVIDVNGVEQLFETKVMGTLALSPENLALIRGSLENITSGARGTARAAFQSITYTVAGKTGTAESGQEKPHAWFAGYAPADTPRVAIAVLLEEAGEGSKEAAPLFRQVLEAYFEWEAGQT
jgi:penicillin-binding protein 2